MRIDTDDLERELEHISCLANIGSTSDADRQQLNDLFYVVMEIAERAHKCMQELQPRPEQPAPVVADKPRAKRAKKGAK
jgi:hypothetical protein